MLRLLYDGTYEGLLSLFYEAVKQKELPEAIRSASKADNTFLYRDRFHETNPRKAARVQAGIASALGRRAERRLFYAFLSPDENREMQMLRYLVRGLCRGRRSLDARCDPVVAAVEELALRVSRERERFLGLARFSEMSDFLYAKIEPESDILCLLGGHFAKRLAPERWILHDPGRKKALAGDGPRWLMTDFPVVLDAPLSEREAFYRSLWKGFYRSVSIESRRNPALRRQHMPMKHWRHLVELESDA